MRWAGKHMFGGGHVLGKHENFQIGPIDQQSIEHDKLDRSSKKSQFPDHGPKVKTGFMFQV
jgi:hypothetical protein